MEIPRFWRTTRQRMRLEGEICPNGHKVFPPRDICPDCGDEAKETYLFNGKGEIYSYTDSLALVRLDEGPLITAGLTDFDHEPQIGEPVEMVTRKLSEQGETGIIIYGYKFRPLVKTS